MVSNKKFKVMKFPNKQQLRQAIMTMKAIDHRLRSRILISLDNKPKSVTELYVELRIDQSVASQHLGILRELSIVNTERMGKHIIYTVNESKIATIHEILKKVTHVAVEQDI